MSELLKQKECEDCGGSPVPHRFTYATIVIDEAIWVVFPPSTRKGSLAGGVAAFEQWASPLMLDFFVKVGLAKKVTESDDETLLLAMVLWEEAKKRGIEMWEWRLFGLARNIFVAKYPNGNRVAFEGIPVAPREHERVWWMDNKARLKKEFQNRGLPVAKGGAARTKNQALRIYRSLTPPVIVKPHSGSASRHTILHITDEAELLRAFIIAKQVSPLAIVEEELEGPVYRATVVDGKFAAALRRDPPHVVGDGVHTIKGLVEEANKHPARSGPYFSKIQLNERAEEELKWQGLTLDSVPPKAARVHFHQKVNWSLGGTTADVTADVHSDNIELFEQAAKELKAPIVGIDFIIKDISRSWKSEPRCGILECNSMPFFDNHHLPFEGEPHNVAAKIWDMVS